VTGVLGGVPMKTPLLQRIFLAFALGASAMAQGRMGRPSGSASDLSGRVPFSFPGTNAAKSQSSIFVLGKVVLDDGTDLTEPVTIQTICSGQKRIEGYSDTHGVFSFQFGDSSGDGAAANDASTSNVGAPGAIRFPRNPRECQLQAVLPGFASQSVELGDRGIVLNSIDVGRVPLHRLEHVEGTTISVTNALAPAGARKALEKGREQEKKGQWEQARKSLEKAVQIYPRYAAAWNELGRLQLRQPDAPSARHSFEQALAADPKYVNPYDGLAQIAMLSRDWQNVIEVTGKLFALDPLSFPDAYYYNSVGNYYLGNLDAAEKSALQGVRMDEAHQIPKLQYLLGMILSQKKDYPAAAQHMQLYLRLATLPADIDLAKKGLAEIEKLSATAALPVPNLEK